MKWFSCLVLILLPVLTACGYSFQGRKNPLKQLGVEKIYVTQFKNRTYRPGVEQMFSTAMAREIQKSGSFRIVNSEEEADAILSGEVVTAEAAQASPKSVEISAQKSVTVASEFTSAVACTILLRDRKGRAIFQHSISSSKVFPGSTNAGDKGATAPLVNDSEQRLAIQFLASQMMSSTYQRMVDTF